MKKPKLIVILGATASGKSDLAVWLAKNLPGKTGRIGSKIGGEIISADSRQVYKGLDIGTGKITKKGMRDVPHHLLDVASPKIIFTAERYKKLAAKAINETLARGNVPILVGGTGFYIQAIVDNVSYPEVKPNPRLRKKLEKKSAVELFDMLKKIDPRRVATIDSKNPRRLVRAIEIASALGAVPIPTKNSREKSFDTLHIGIKTDDPVLKKKIRTRLVTRLKKGMISEAAKLHRNGLSWKRMNELGLEYRYLALFLQKKISKAELVTKLNSEIWNYAKRQKTWFKKDRRIQWFDLGQKKNIKKTVALFLEK